MSTVDTKSAIQQARKEFAEEKQKKAVKLLKEKFVALDAAETVVANLEREIVDLEEAIKQGNI